MKHLIPLVLTALFTGSIYAESSAPAKAPESKLTSDVFDWEKMDVTTTPTGVRRAVFDGATATVDKVHCHISTLNPGEKSGDPRKHLQEEVIIVKEGTLEANFDGKSKTGGPGSVIFFAAGSTTFLRNTGKTPATYVVIYYYTPLTPKS
jgi:quercetin dioxygenase-like cupin family protein